MLSTIIPKQLYAQVPAPCPCDNCVYLQANFPYVDASGVSGCANPGPAPYLNYDAAATQCVNQHSECNFIPVNDYSAFLALLGVGLILITKIGVKPFLAFIKKQFVGKKYSQG
jgi:hypothetical protein